MIIYCVKYKQILRSRPNLGHTVSEYCLVTDSNQNPVTWKLLQMLSRVSKAGSRLGRAGTAGLGKAVEFLDTLGSNMTNLNPNVGFPSSVVTKSDRLSILSFEVANTIVKGSNLMNSLSKRSIKHLKEVVFPSEGVQNLISNDMDEFLNIVAADKREELKVFFGEVVSFGNRCNNPRWHNLKYYFDIDLTSRRQLKEKTESVMELLMALVQYTAELYHELQVLDRIELEYQRNLRKCLEDNAVTSQKGGNLAILRAELKSQIKLVRNLKKKSLWCRSWDEAMEKLVDIVHFLLLEIHDIFGSADDVVSKILVNNHKRLEPAGLSLHYANVVLQIDSLVARSYSMSQNTRGSLYQNLPRSIKSSLRSKLQSFHVKEELTVAEIKDEMEKTLQWLVPLSTNTAKAYHSFGRFGEWVNTVCETNRKPAAAADIIRMQTLHHANTETTEAYILELVLWLQHLANKSKNGANGGKKLPIKSPISIPLEKSNQTPKDELPNAPSLSIEDQVMLQDISKKKRMPGISKSLDKTLGKPS